MLFSNSGKKFSLRVFVVPIWIKFEGSVSVTTAGGHIGRLSHRLWRHDSCAI